MKKLLLIVAIVLSLSFAAFAQADSAAPKKSKTKAADENKTSQLTGCITGPNAEGAYMLTNGRHRKGVEVGGTDDLKNHVGHQVKLNGTWSDAKAIGVTEQAEKTAGNSGSNTAAMRKFKVEKITMVSDTCPATGAAKSGKSGKKKADEAPKQ
jgi:hypothetical protein